ncbi:MAG: hypothetical protein GY920_20190 [Aliivibrio sp.]|nr:hypothetical protein [Aliivibrio sp.]MCP4322144.1 hypothetical protein [Alteromonadales bacterium]
MNVFDADITAYEHYRNKLVQVMASFDNIEDYITALSIAREVVMVEDRLSVLKELKTSSALSSSLKGGAK